MTQTTPFRVNSRIRAARWTLPKIQIQARRCSGRPSLTFLSALLTPILRRKAPGRAKTVEEMETAGMGALPEARVASEVRCNECRTWFDAKIRACPECDTLRPGFSSHLYTSMLNNHLYSQAASAEKERSQYAAIQKGYEVPPTRNQRKLARQIVADM